MSTAPSRAQIADALQKHLPAGCRALLFGSRATGSARALSDWDIGLYAGEPLPGALMTRIRTELEELPTLHEFDVVDLARVPDGFRERALQEGLDLVEPPA